MHPPIAANGLDDSHLERAGQLLAGTQTLAVLTGAGVSAESGVPTFRDADGLWEGHPVEQVATPQAFRQDPRLVWKFYNVRRETLARVEPNPCHHALARLEATLGNEHFDLITQNVDGLHHAAGNRRVIELHGNLRRTRCTGCGRTTDHGLAALEELPTCEACQALLRPDVVWFTEHLPPGAWESAQQAVARCDTLLVIGTSAVVYPAAGLITTARLGGAKIIECNLQRTAASHLADVSLLGPAGRIMPLLVEFLPDSRRSAP